MDLPAREESLDKCSAMLKQLCVVPAYALCTVGNAIKTRKRVPAANRNKLFSQSCYSGQFSAFSSYRPLNARKCMMCVRYSQVAIHEYPPHRYRIAGRRLCFGAGV